MTHAKREEWLLTCEMNEEALILANVTDSHS